MTKVDSIQLDFRLCRRRLKGIALASRLEKRVRLELGEEKLDLSSGCLVRVGAVGTVPRVSQPELTSDAVGLFVSRREAEGGRENVQNVYWPKLFCSCTKDNFVACSYLVLKTLVGPITDLQCWMASSLAKT